MSPLLELFRVDFARDTEDDVPRKVAVEFTARASGRVDALMLSWEVFLDPAGTVSISTHPSQTKDNSCRDMGWGQALVFLADDGAEDDDGWVGSSGGSGEQRSRSDGEEGGEHRAPRPITVRKGARYVLRFAHVGEFWTIRARLEEVAEDACDDGAAASAAWDDDDRL